MFALLHQFFFSKFVVKNRYKNWFKNQNIGVKNKNIGVKNKNIGVNKLV